MTEQHPLTDDKCYELWSGNLYENERMRAAADWQLEEVMRKVELKLKEWRIQGYEYDTSADACEDFFEEVMQELRPQQQQQENN